MLSAREQAVMATRGSALGVVLSAQRETLDKREYLLWTQDFHSQLYT